MWPWLPERVVVVHIPCVLTNCFGGIASGGARLLRYLARRASDKKRGRDGTKYRKLLFVIRQILLAMD